MTTTTSTYSPLSYFGYVTTSVKPTGTTPPFTTTSTPTPTPFITTTTTTTTPTPTPTIVKPTITFSYNDKTVKELTINVGDSIVLTYYVNNPSRLSLYYEHYNSNSYVASSVINYGYFEVNANNIGSTLIGITLKTGIASAVGGGNVKVNVINPATTTPYITTTTTSTTSTTYIPTPTPTPDNLSNYGIKAFNLHTDNSYVSYSNGYTRIYPNIVIVPENSYHLIKSVDYYIDNPRAISFTPDKPLYSVISDGVSPIDVYNLNNCSEDTPNTVTAYAKLVNGFTKVSTITLTVQGQPKPTLSPYEKSLVDKLANHISQILFDKEYQ